MNKTKIILCATGGVIGLLVIVMAVFVWMALADKTAAIEGDEENDGLEAVVSQASQLSRKPVYPSAASVKAIAGDVEKLDTWKADAVKLVARGDRAFNPTTAAAFKTFLAADAKRLQEGFEFGPFKEYISGGALPETKDLPRLQRQWDDIALITETLSAAGMKKLVDVSLAAVVEEEPKEEEKAKSKSKAKKPKGKTAKVENAFKPSRESYVFTFQTPADGLVKAVNAFATCERFVVVEDFTFKRAQDVIASALGGEAKSEAAQTSGGRRGRRRQAAQVQEEETQDEQKGGIVTDPVIDPPLVVTMTLAVYDFRSLEEKPEEKTEE